MVVVTVIVAAVVGVAVAIPIVAIAVAGITTVAIGVVAVAVFVAIAPVVAAMVAGFGLWRESGEAEDGREEKGEWFDIHTVALTRGRWGYSYDCVLLCSGTVEGELEGSKTRRGEDFLPRMGTDETRMVEGARSSLVKIRVHPWLN
jgi:hypothetical protein